MKVGDLVMVVDDRLDPIKSVGLITNIFDSEWKGIKVYKLLSQGKELRVLKTQLWCPNEER
tara:strand:- start:327 stop:509 length:183 start_codon:yes stop_codon:yes gene_type:complete